MSWEYALFSRWLVLCVIVFGLLVVFHLQGMVVTGLRIYLILLLSIYGVVLCGPQEKWGEQTHMPSLCNSGQR